MQYIINYQNSQNKEQQVKVSESIGRKFMDEYEDAKATELVTIPKKNIMVQKRKISGIEQIQEKDSNFDLVQIDYNIPLRKRLEDWLWRKGWDNNKELAEELICEFGEEKVAKAGRKITEEDNRYCDLLELKFILKKL